MSLHLQLTTCRIKSALNKSFKIYPECKLLLLPNHCLALSGNESDGQSAPLRIDTSFESPVVHRIIPPLEADSLQPLWDGSWSCLLNAVVSTPFVVQVLIILQAPLLFPESSRNSYLWEFVFLLFSREPPSTYGFFVLLLAPYCFYLLTDFSYVFTL